jgi:transcriptional regulator with XRE-family HTH domain
MARQRVKVDEVALAGDFVTGMYSQSELAAKYGLSRSAVEKIVSGRRRPDVQRMIETARQAAAGRAKERLAELLSPALGVLARAMEGEPSARAISAAKAVLDRTLGRPVPAGAAGAWATGVVQDCRHGPDLTDLSPETKRLVLRELGYSGREIDQNLSDELAREQEDASDRDGW